MPVTAQVLPPRAALALALLVACAGAAATSDEARCAALARTPLPPLPAAEEVKAWRAEKRPCASWLEGLGVPRDLSKARACCLSRGDCQGELPLIYSSGMGVPVDYQMASRLACEADAATAEVGLMLDRIAELQAGAKGTLDYCALVTSGYGTSRCAALEELRQKERAQAQAAGPGAASPEQQQALARLRQAFAAFRDADAAHSADQLRGGSGAGLAAAAAKKELDELFAHRLAAEAAPAATRTAEELATVDAALNRSYQTRLAAADPQAKGLLKAAQRAWIKYRDAQVAWSLLRWQEADAKALALQLRYELTDERVQQLAFADGAAE
jgi:uncharacterized protein YecT (DUF1311 family)